MQHTFKWNLHLKYRNSTKEQLDDKMLAQRYLGLCKDKYGEWSPLFDKIRVSRFFLKTLESRNKASESKDENERVLQDRIRAIRDRVYSSRTFPHTLKQIIFERDNYSCKICGRHLAHLTKIGLHLEADHIHEWEDGGQTTFKNGQALCSECNNAKHHSKVYFLHGALLKDLQ